MALMVAPSVLAVWDKSGGDVGEVVHAARVARVAGADWIHVDVMDGKFVPAVTFGPEVVRALQGTGPLDVHLMVERPEDVVQAYVRAGADRVVFHPRASDDVGGTLRKIAALGAVAGLALDVDEDVSWLEPWMDDPEQTLVQQVLVMTVKAGVGGQSFRDDMLGKINHVRRLVGPRVAVVVDGGVTPEHAPKCAAAGASCVVAGSAVFNAPDVAAAIAALRAGGA